MHHITTFRVCVKEKKVMTTSGAHHHGLLTTCIYLWQSESEGKGAH